MKLLYQIIIFVAAIMITLTTSAQKPVIGIAATPGEKTHSVGLDYVAAVARAGGIPLLIPATSDTALLVATLEHVDGILLAGGVDVDPSFFGEERHSMLGEVNADRDTFELTLIGLAVAQKMPVFGVCRGLQMINVALGGTLFQDIPSQVPDAGRHRVIGDSTNLVAHSVKLEPGTVSARVMGATEFDVNSRHHQSVRRIAPSLKVTAYSPDGIVEMIEGYPAAPILAVQWHPENFVAHGDTTLMLRFFNFLIEESSRYQAKRNTK